MVATYQRASCDGISLARAALAILAVANCRTTPFYTLACASSLMGYCPSLAPFVQFILCSLIAPHPLHSNTVCPRIPRESHSSLSSKSEIPRERTVLTFVCSLQWSKFCNINEYIAFFQ